MVIEYLYQLINKKDKGRIKIITGIIKWEIRFYVKKTFILKSKDSIEMIQMLLRRKGWNNIKKTISVRWHIRDIKHKCP